MKKYPLQGQHLKSHALKGDTYHVLVMHVKQHLAGVIMAIIVLMLQYFRQEWGDFVHILFIQ